MATYTLISSNVLSSSAASVTFSSIPATYTDLVLRISARGDDTGTYIPIDLRFNGDTATNYSRTFVYGTGASVGSSRNTSVSTARAQYSGNANDATANSFGSSEFYIPSYLVSQNKPLGSFGVSETNSATSYMDASALLWRNTAAITSVTVYPNVTGGSYNWLTGSSFYLYGISNA